jgi:hypothetical protein
MTVKPYLFGLTVSKNTRHFKHELIKNQLYQDRQRKDSATMRRVRATIVAVEKQ